MSGFFFFLGDFFDRFAVNLERASPEGIGKRNQKKNKDAKFEYRDRLTVRKRFLTLIEIITVVAILLVVTVVIGFNIRKALITQRFNSETALFVDTIRLAQDMMFVLSRDVWVKVRGLPDEEGVEYFIEVDGVAPRDWQKLVARSRRKMETVHYINFLQKDSFPSLIGQIDLRFQSRGSMMSQGEIQMASHEDPNTSGALRRVVCLKGFPHAILIQSVPQSPGIGLWSQCEAEIGKDFFDQLTQYTREEIEQDQRQRTIQNGDSEKDGGTKEGQNSR